METAINTYIANYDKSAQQYVSLRQEILAQFNGINKDLQEGKPISDERKLRVAELEIELDRVSATYERHVRHLNQVVGAQSQLVSGTVEEVGLFHDNIEKEDKELLEEIQYIQSIKGTVLEDMRELVKDVDQSMRRAKAGTNGNAKRQVSKEARTFTRDELKVLVDDIKLDMGDSDTVVSLARYLDEQLENGRAFKKADGDTFIYDPRSSGMKEADIGVSGAEYDTKISQMVRSLSTLISDNARAKESWGENARLLEAVHQTMLLESGDTEMAD